MGDPGQVTELGAFTSRLAAQWVAEAPEARHRSSEGSLVSADLSGFTAMSERLAERGKEGAERLTQVVNGCFTALIDAAGREGGDVLKFGGDALLLWFDGDDHPTRAARAAVRMQRAIGATRFKRAGLRMSVGAHTDRFDLFLVGRPDWRELVLAGAPVTTTVDLEAAAEAGQVLVSPAMATQLPERWLGPDTAAGVVLATDAVPLPRRVPVTHAPSPGAAVTLVPPRLRADLHALADLGGEHRLATIAFAELEGTDASLATVGGAAFAASVDDLVQAVQDASDRLAVQLLYTDVIADGIKLLCTAGAPATTGQDEEAALRFATALVPGDPKGKLRAGVHRGRVFAGFLGSPDRRTYTVMGDPVNLAARLMAKAEPGQVVASADAVHHSRAGFATVDLAPFLVKGKQHPVSAVVVGELTGQRRGRAASSLPLVGREEEVDQLRGLIGLAVEGAGQVVEVVGDAGIGKTRLLAAVTDDDRLLVRVTTECQPYDLLSPYASVRPLLRRALSIPVEATPAEAGRLLQRAVARSAPELAPLLPLVAVPLGAEVAATPEADAVAEEFRTERTRQVVRELLAATLTAPTMLVVEDVYYVDDASLHLLQAIAQQVPTHPWVLLVTRRPDGPGLVVGPVAGTLVKLQPLSGTTALRLAEEAAGDRHIGALDLDVMAQRSGGNPLFVLQLVDAAGDGVAADDLPESIERLVATRIDRLDPSDRALLRQAAVVGRVFDVALIDGLLVAEGVRAVGPERWEGLDDLIEREDDHGRWRFRHALFRDVAYEGLPFARRKRMHRAVGELLEARAGGSPDLALLSQHFWLAGDAERTWRYSVAAGDAAWASYAVAEAIAAYRRALGVRRRLKDLDPAEVGQVAEALGDVLERAARYEEADAAYRLARDAPAGDGSQLVLARLTRKRGVLAERGGEFTTALRRYRRAMRSLDHSRTDHVIELARAELAYGTVRHRQGFHKELVEWAQRAASHAEIVGDRRIVATAHNHVQVAITHGAQEPSTWHGERALAEFRELGDEQYIGKALNNLGIDGYYRGRWTEAASRYEAAHASFIRAGDLTEAASALQNLGEIRCDQGRYGEADDLFRQAEREWRTAGFGIGVPLTEMNRARCMARAGRRSDALGMLERASETFSTMGAGSFVRDAGTWRAELHLLAGDPRGALAALDEVAVVGDAFPATKVRALRLRGWALLQLDRASSASETLLDALAASKAEQIAFEELLVLHGLCEIPTASTALRRDPGWEAAATSLRHRLGVVQLPVFPLPG